MYFNVLFSVFIVLVCAPTQRQMTKTSWLLCTCKYSTV